MLNKLRISSAIFLIAFTVLFQREAAGNTILETSSFWRYFYVMKMPLINADGKVQKLEELPEYKDFTGKNYIYLNWLVNYEPQLPSSNWNTSDFDDILWTRIPGVLVPNTYDKYTSRSNSSKNIEKNHSPFQALLCVRGKFRVNNPSSAGKLKLSMQFRGGVVVYLNGKEVVRSFLPKNKKITPLDTADEYKEGESIIRKIDEAVISNDCLVKGTNVLAVEIHRSPYRASDVVFAKKWPQGIFISKSSCGMDEISLTTADSPAVVVPNISRPRGMQIWNSDAMAPDFDLDYGDPNEPLRPVYIVGTINGSFSGKVVLGSTDNIRGLKVTAGDLDLTGFKGKSIPSSAVRIRYGHILDLPVGNIGGEKKLSGESEFASNARYLAEVNRFDAMEEIPMPEIPVRKKKANAENLKASSDVPVVFGAVVPVWITVDIPADAVPGDYEGKIKITATGEKSIEAAVKLRVCGWKMPSPNDFKTIVEVVESPESVALWYDVPLWSEKHFNLLDKSMKILGQVGNKVIYIPLICETNMGNSETMVRWIKQADGTFKYDFTIMDKYLDLVEKHMGKPPVICFYAWDCFLSRVRGGRSDEKWQDPEVKQGYEANKDSGPEVSLLTSSGKVEKYKIPVPYFDPKSEAVWKPLANELISRMKKRGLEKSMMLGIASDYAPDKGTIELFKKIFPGVPWVSHPHEWLDNISGVPCEYRSCINSHNDLLDPGDKVKNVPGWKSEDMKTHFTRLINDNFPLSVTRIFSEIAVARGYRGIARLGGDFWPVLPDKSGTKVGKLAASYTKSFWNNQNILTMYILPGKEGAVSTHRLELIREGTQDTEARTFIEKTGVSAKQQEILDERTRTMFLGVSNLLLTSTNAANRVSWWNLPGVAGSYWYIGSGWLERSQNLYNLAGEVSGKRTAFRKSFSEWMKPELKKPDTEVKTENTR